MPSRRTNNFPESGRGLGHVTPTIFGSTVGYPSDSLASCILCYVLLWRNKRWMDIDELLYYWLLYIHWLLLTKEHCPKPDETKQEISDKTNKDEHQSSVKCLTHRLIAFFVNFVIRSATGITGPRLYGYTSKWRLHNAFLTANGTHGVDQSRGEDVWQWANQWECIWNRRANDC